MANTRGERNENGYDENEIKIFNSKRDLKIDPNDVKCGSTCFHPKWLQIFACKEAFVLVYAIVGMLHFILGTYHTGIISTTEKAFSMSSLQSGLITAAWDFGNFFMSISVTCLAAKGHQIHWIATGTFLFGIASFIRILPHYIYGSSDVVKMYTKEYNNNNTSEFIEMTNSTVLRRLGINAACKTEKYSQQNASIFYITLLAQVLVGMGSAVYWTCGAAYMDDNIRKNVVPIVLAIIQYIRLFGPIVGYILAAHTLKVYAEPSSTPLINSEDPRWIGAWWLGWYPLSYLSLLMAALLYLFPKTLPRAAARNRRRNVRNSEGASFSDFKHALKRLSKNKIIVCNSLSSLCFTMGLVAYWTYLPKYMESQFRLSPSKSNFLTGTVNILCNGLGVMSAGLIVSKIRPSSRLLAGWNVLSEIIDIIGHVIYMFLGCPQPEYHGHWNPDRSWNLTETCNANLDCMTDTQFSPVCDSQTGVTYYSWCHAGCNVTKIIEGITEYTNCSCVPNSRVINGTCPADCSTNIFWFTIIMAIMSFTHATGRSGNTIIQFRIVDERDRSLSLGVTETLLALFAFIPAPVIYGTLLDWTCIIWGDNCGERSNCWLYDNQQLRLAFNLIACGFFVLGTISDCFVWYYVKEVKMFDDDETGSKAPTVKNTIDIELPLMNIPTQSS